MRDVARENNQSDPRGLANGAENTLVQRGLVFVDVAHGRLHLDAALIMC